MDFKPDQTYLMPASFGEMPRQEVADYGDALNIAAVYLTDRDALAALLPPPYEPADEPLVTVFYSKCNKVDFLAGGGYNLMGVNLAAVFNGREDHITGNFAAVLWENLTIPITLGRELLGCPKLYGDIPDPFRLGDDWRVQTSENGHILVEVFLGAVQPAAGEVLNLIRAGSGMPWMGWRCFPNVNGRGVALSEPTLMASEAQIDQAWIAAEMRVSFGDVSPLTNPIMAHIIPKLKTLVVKEYRAGVITRGSSRLLISRNRVLR